MADKNYKITFEMSDGSEKSVEFTAPQGDTGETGPEGPQGPKGDTPVRGTDYWTEADKAEIKAYVDEAILGGAW